MIHENLVVEAESSAFPPLPPPRAELPTLPFDLSEYAREHAGPDDDDLVAEMSVGSLVAVGPDKLPRLAIGRDEFEGWPLDHREGFILSLIDGATSVEAILDVAGMPEGEALFVLCDLCARGLVVLE